MTRGPKRNTERELAMCEAFKSGKTLRQIGEEYGVCRERVRQLIKRHGITGPNGGQHVRCSAEMIARQRDLIAKKADREQKRYLHVLGCTKDEYVALTGVEWSWAIQSKLQSATPGGAYVIQMRNAGQRGIDWRMTFPEWWAIWQQSGHWTKRGRGSGYVMARYGDAGAYEASNVYICTAGQNASDSYLVKPWHQRFQGRYQDNRGGRSWQAADLRAQGLTYSQIAERLGIPRTNVGAYVRDGRRYQARVPIRSAA